MPEPSLKVLWDDQSEINQPTVPVEDTVDRPIIMAVAATAKGPEEWKKKLYGQDWFDYYGEAPSFIKYGQPAIQAANIISAGGYLTFKRIVANDATLANIGVVAEVKNTQKQKTDESGVPLYIDASTGKPTTNPVGNAPIMENHVNINYTLKSISLDGNNVNDFANALLADFRHTNAIGEDGQYPLFLITDNGRGVSNKRFRIYQDTTQSKPVNYARYFLDVMENGTTLETIAFTMNPDIIEKESNMSLQNQIRKLSKQLRCVFFDDEYTAFAQNVSYLISGDSDGEFKYADCIFGTDLWGETYDNITIGADVNLSTIYGIQLENGSNGEFGDRPINATTYAAQLKKAFDGSFSNDIYDLDNNRIDAIFDANYPDSVKRSIEQLVNFREDCVYFRDMGLGVSSLEEIRLKDEVNYKSRFCCTYLNSYDIFDPFTKKQISVTIMYDLARLFVKHFINGRNRPFCGQKYDVVIPQETMVPGTLNYSPKHTPQVNERKELDDLRINYCSYYDGDILTMNSEYTSQTRYTQLSWVNNVLAVQEIIKAIRVICPKIRYTFLDGEDLTKYKKDVENFVIDKYADRFKSCEIQYVSNAEFDSNKIIYAVINVKFRNFIQTEIFKIVCLQS